MPQISLRVDLVPHPLFQDLGFRKAVVQLALPYLHTVAGDVKGPARGTSDTLPRSSAKVESSS